MGEELSEILLTLGNGNRIKVLEDAEGVYCTSNMISTNNDESIGDLREDWKSWVKSENFEYIRKNPIDLAIVFSPRIGQDDVDVDNFAKKVVCALQNHEIDKENRYLINDDSQIQRMLVQKTSKLDKNGLITVSFRTSNLNKPMKLVSPEKI